eukprot:ctg_1975.g480
MPRLGRCRWSAASRAWWECRAVVGDQLHVAAVFDQPAGVAQSNVLVAVELGEAPLAGHEDALSPGELVLATAQCLLGHVHMLLLDADTDQRLADFDARHRALWLAESAAHPGLQSIRPSARQHLVDTDDVKRVHPHPQVERVLAGVRRQILLRGHSCRLQRLTGQLLLFVRHQIHAHRVLVGGRLLASQVVDADLGVGHTAAVPRLGVRLVLAVAIATRRPTSHDGGQEKLALGSPRSHPLSIERHHTRRRRSVPSPASAHGRLQVPRGAVAEEAVGSDALPVASARVGVSPLAAGASGDAAVTAGQGAPPRVPRQARLCHLSGAGAAWRAQAARAQGHPVRQAEEPGVTQLKFQRNKRSVAEERVGRRILRGDPGGSESQRHSARPAHQLDMSADHEAPRAARAHQRRPQRARSAQEGPPRRQGAPQRSQRVETP